MGKVIEAIPMRGSIVGLLVVALLCPFGVSIAKPIVYNVHISDSTETVSGTLTTDGTIGELSAGAFTAWNLTAVGPVSLSIASIDRFASSVCAQTSGPVINTHPCGITATASELRLSSITTGSFTQFVVPFTHGADEVTFYQTLPRVVASDFFELGSPPPYTIALAPPFVIASIPDIEPSTGLLLGLAFASLVFARKRVEGSSPLR